jgi:hypothetical protein
VLARQPFVHVDELRGAHREASLLEARQDLAREPTLHRVGLDQDECAFRHRRSSSRIRRSRASSGSSRFLAFQKIQLTYPSTNQGMIIAKRAMIDRINDPPLSGACIWASTCTPSG